MHHYCQLLTPVLRSEPMGYIHEVERGLRVLLANVRPDDQEAIVRFCKEKILESYRNGQEAATNGTTSTPAAPQPRKPRTFIRKQ